MAGGSARHLFFPSKSLSTAHWAAHIGGQLPRPRVRKEQGLALRWPLCNLASETTQCHLRHTLLAPVTAKQGEVDPQESLTNTNTWPHRMKLSQRQRTSQGAALGTQATSNAEKQPKAIRTSHTDGHCSQATYTRHVTKAQHISRLPQQIPEACGQKAQGRSYRRLDLAMKKSCVKTDSKAAAAPPGKTAKLCKGAHLCTVYEDTCHHAVHDPMHTQVPLSPLGWS